MTISLKKQINKVKWLLKNERLFFPFHMHRHTHVCVHGHIHVCVHGHKHMCARTQTLSKCTVAMEWNMNE